MINLIVHCNEGSELFEPFAKICTSLRFSTDLVIAKIKKSATTEQPQIFQTSQKSLPRNATQTAWKYDFLIQEPKSKSYTYTPFARKNSRFSDTVYDNKLLQPAILDI